MLSQGVGIRRAFVICIWRGNGTPVGFRASRGIRGVHFEMGIFFGRDVEFTAGNF